MIFTLEPPKCLGRHTLGRENVAATKSFNLLQEHFPATFCMNSAGFEFMQHVAGKRFTRQVFNFASCALLLQTASGSPGYKIEMNQ